MLNIKQQVNIDGVPTMVLQSELQREVVGQDELGNDIYGDYIKDYKADMTVDTKAIQAKNLAETKEGIDTSIETYFNTKAKEWGFNSIDRAVSYVGSENPEWNAEGVLFRTWRDRVWAYIYVELQKVEQGVRELPTPEGVLTEIPQLETVADELGVQY